jgi:hypothetical protein
MILYSITPSIASAKWRRSKNGALTKKGSKAKELFLVSTPDGNAIMDARSRLLPLNSFQTITFHRL